MGYLQQFLGTYIIKETASFLRLQILLDYYLCMYYDIYAAEFGRCMPDCEHTHSSITVLLAFAKALKKE